MAYHSKITDIFGKDLYKLLGPKAERRPWASLSESEKKKRLRAIPVYVPTRSLGKHPKLIDIVIFCLNRLANMGMDNPLLGIELPEFDSLVQAAEKMNVPALNYDTPTLQSIISLFKNSAKQRDVFLRHIFEDIIFRFNPGLVFPGIGRMNSKGMLFVNDAQHRTLACIILGIEHVPVTFINSDDEYWDVAQYAGINIHSLTASEFDKYRIRVQRRIEAVNAGYEPEIDDEICFELHELFTDLNIEVVEKVETGSKALVLTGIGNMIKYRGMYAKSYFHRSVQLNAQMFPTSKFHTANSLGLMEFLRHQKNNSLETVILDYGIMSALKVRWPKNNAGNQMHSNIKESYRIQTGVPATSSRTPEQLILAHGIWQVCKHYNPDIDWTEPEWNEKEHGPKFILPLV